MKNRSFLTVMTLLFLVVTPLSVLAQVDNLPQADTNKKSPDNKAGFEISLPENFPVKNFEPEFGDSNGKDDNNNGMVDECVQRLGTCMIIMYNTDGEPDDEFDLRVDGQYQGRYVSGKARFWDLMLTTGKHEVSVEAISDLDNSGNYSIEFEGCKKIQGPPTDMFNLTEQTFYTWEVEVPEPQINEQ